MTKTPRCKVCGHKMIPLIQTVIIKKKRVEQTYMACKVHGAPGRM